MQNQIAASVQEKLAKLVPDISIISQNIETTNRKQIILTTPDLVLTLGSKAAYSTLKPQAPVLHALITENMYRNLAGCNGLDYSLANQVYGLHLDQPVSRQLNLLKLLLPSKNRIGVLTGSFSANTAHQLEILARKQQLNIFVISIDEESQLNRKMKELLEKIDVFIALPDPLIHNRRTIPHLLLTTYRYHIPMIGFSRAYVTAGAIASTYSSTEQITTQIAEFIPDILSDKPPKPGSYPSNRFEVAINKNVARSFDLDIPDEQSLKKQLLMLEK